MRRQPRNFANMTLVARRREHFRGFLAIFLVAQLSPKRSVLVHKNSLASCQQCCHSVEPRALTCPFNHSDLYAASASKFSSRGSGNIFPGSLGFFNSFCSHQNKVFQCTSIAFVATCRYIYSDTRRESSKRNYYIISPKVKIKAIIIIFTSTDVHV